jgi:hypothetical protein
MTINTSSVPLSSLQNPLDTNTPVKKTILTNEEIKGIVENVFSTLKENQPDKENQPECSVKETLASLKEIKTYTYQQQHFIVKILLAIGLMKNEGITTLDVAIKKIELHIQVGDLLTDEDTKFLSIINKEEGKRTDEEKLVVNDYLNDIDNKSHLKVFFDEVAKKNIDYKILSQLLITETGNEKGFSFDEKVLDSLSKLYDLNNKMTKFISRKGVDTIVSKMEALLKKYDNKEEIEKKDKLTIKEFATFDVLPEVPNCVLNFIKQLDDSNSFKEKIEKRNKMECLRWGIEKNINAQLNSSSLFNGCITFVDVYKFEKIRNRSGYDLSTTAQVIATRSSKNHVGLFYKDVLGNYLQSEVSNQYQKRKFDFDDLVNSTMRSIDWKKIIDSSLHSLLENKYGKKWKDEIQKQYSQKCSEFHENNPFNNLDNDPWRRVASVFKLPVQWKEAKIDAELFKDRKMFCSEFAGLSTKYILDELNEELSQLKGDDDQPLFQDKNIIKPIFGKNPNFGAMHPGRLWRTLEPYTNRLKPLPIVEALVDLE